MAVLQIRSGKEIRVSGAKLRSRLEAFVRKPRPIRDPGPGGCEWYGNFRIPDDLVAQASEIAGLSKTAVARALALEGPDQPAIAIKVPAPSSPRVSRASPATLSKPIPSPRPKSRNVIPAKPASSRPAGETIAEATRRHVEELRAQGWTVDDCGNSYRTIGSDET